MLKVSPVPTIRTYHPPGADFGQRTGPKSAPSIGPKSEPNTNLDQIKSRTENSDHGPDRINPHHVYCLLFKKVDSHYETLFHIG